MAATEATTTNNGEPQQEHPLAAHNGTYGRLIQGREPHIMPVMGGLYVASAQLDKHDEKERSGGEELVVFVREPEGEPHLGDHSVRYVEHEDIALIESLVSPSDR